jgi:hypothetical protein
MGEYFEQSPATANYEKYMYLLHIMCVFMCA